MKKRILMAVVVALLTAVGVVVPDRYVDKFVSLFIPPAEASAYDFNQAYLSSRTNCDRPVLCWQPCKIDPIMQATGEALRPSFAHYSANRVRTEIIPRGSSGIS